MIKIGKDPYLKKEIHKVLFDDRPKVQYFNQSDVYLGHPSSNIAVAFIYTWKDDHPPEHVKKFMEKLSNYAYISGFWRTTNGARYVFSNILANPNVNKLFVFVFDYKDNGHALVNALKNFWKNGIRNDGTIKGSIAQNPKFEQIPHDALQRIRKQCDLVVVDKIDKKEFGKIEYMVKNSINEPKNPVNLEECELSPVFISNVVDKKILYDDGARFKEPYHIDLSQNASTVEYRERNLSNVLGQSIQAETLDEALKSAVAFIFKNGSVHVDDRGIITIECRSFTVTITDALSKVPDGFSNGYIKNYVEEFMEGPKNPMEYNYHERIFKRWGNQVERVVEMLEDHSSTRRMVISLWDQKSDLENPCPPCLDIIWVCIRNDKLEMHVLFRSHHIATVTEDGKLMKGEGAFVPNIIALVNLQNYIAKKLEVERGAFVLSEFSGHLYTSKVKNG